MRALAGTPLLLHFQEPVNLHDLPRQKVYTTVRWTYSRRQRQNIGFPQIPQGCRFTLKKETENFDKKKKFQISSSFLDEIPKKRHFGRARKAD
jgi:hypothetical protein